jgi:hypothetical protein
VKVTNVSAIESVTLTTDTVLKFGNDQFSANLSEQVIIGPEEEVELVFDEEEIPELSAGAYEVTVEFHGTGYYQEHIVKEKIHIPPETLVINAANSPVIVRGDCEFANVDIVTNGKMVFDGSTAHINRVTVGPEGKIYKHPSGKTDWYQGGRIDEIHVEEDLMVQNYGRIYGNFIITAPNLTIDFAGTISCSGDGAVWDKGGGPDNKGVGKEGSATKGGGGGGYGGKGGDGENNPNSGGETYDGHYKVLGSGGGSAKVDEMTEALAGRGGGCLVLYITGTLHVKGYIYAEGEPGLPDTKTCPTVAAGGGSGGTILIKATEFKGGSGLISANGGDGGGFSPQSPLPGGSGGGGRIRIESGKDLYTGYIWRAAGQVRSPATRGEIGTLHRAEYSGYVLVQTEDGTFRFVKVDLAAKGHNFASPKTGPDVDVSEEEEENPGAYAHWNVDDDDENGTADYTETGPITANDGENDLKKVVATFETQPTGPISGKLVLRRSNANIQVWTSATKGGTNALLTGATYSADTEGNGKKTWNLPDELSDFNTVKDSLYVEGRASGTAELTLTYKVTYKATTHEVTDKVKYTLIAATCGSAPTVAQRNKFEAFFPNLVHCEWSVTGSATASYNCLAWAVGETSVWYSAKRIDEDFGDNDGIFETSDVDAFYLAKKGWTPTASGPEDAKAIYWCLPTDWNYRVGDPLPTPGGHAAAKRDCACGAGKWIMFESKCGQDERIEHVWDQLDGPYPAYGTLHRFYK